MRFLTLARYGNNAQAGPPPPELFEALGKLGAQAQEAGVLVDTAGLAPSAAGGARVRLAGGELEVTLEVTDGPFDNGTELGSYAIYEVESKEEVVDWATRFMNLHKEYWPGWEGQTEILQIFGGLPE